MWPWVIVCAVALVVLLYAETRADATVAVVAKVIASGAFIAAALSLGALRTLGGQALLLALAWSFVGDVLLAFRGSRPAFAMGIAAFALAHLGYVVFFDLRGVDWTALGVAALVFGVAGALFFRWLRPRVARRAPALQLPVALYVVVITSMVAFAIGSVALIWQPLPLAAALAFWLSDVAVALTRFADAPPLVRRVGLPLYYAAQFMFVAMLPGAMG